MGLSFHAERLSATLRDQERVFCLDASGFDLGPGEIVALSGESGCGKTLLLELLCLIRRPDPGAVFALIANGGRVDLGDAWNAIGAATDIPALRARLFGFVPQTGGLFAFLSARENIALSQKIVALEDADHTTHLIDVLGLTSVADLFPDQLSIGQRQRVAIARALAHRPAAVIADEPTAALDPRAARAVIALLTTAARETGTAVVLSCHDLALLREAGLPRLTFDVSEPDGDNRVISHLNRERVE